MKSGTGRQAGHAAPIRTCFRRSTRAVGALVGVLATLSVGFAPSATAYDAQSQQWYFGPMKADQMWRVSTGKGVKVAVIDTGVNPNTPSLKGQVLADEVPNAVAYKATDDFTGHGTTMAELIAGTGSGGGLKGLAPGAKIVPYRVDLEGLPGGKSEEKKTPKIAQAIRAAADTDAKIISMSFGGFPDPEDEDAINYAASKGKLLIAAVGNAGKSAKKDLIDYPAAYSYVIGVAAADESGAVSKFSSSGGYVDLTAPGQGFPGWCDTTFRSYCEREGTSPATALTSAAAALIWSVHPNWTVNQVVRSLVKTAGRKDPSDRPSKYIGYGMVRPRLVLEDASFDPGPAHVDPLAKENGGDLLAKAGTSAASSAPSSSASTPSQAPAKGSTGGTSAAGSSAESSSDSNTLWIALGAVAAVIVIGGGGAAVMRARRAR
ncbi:S8 family serine peptidase [Streptomyces sp. NPDC015414]|uniref:S8 family serine peptidase n=1 Tax=Streptomyces sp. NPDC015414 TaxID=3364957 RepID=UPI0036FE0E94